MYRQNHWTPFGHPQITLEWKLFPREALRLYANSAPGSFRCLIGEDKDGRCHGVERGSLWYWLHNANVYPSYYQKHIVAAICNASPTLGEAAELGDPGAEHAAAFLPTDTWVAQDPLTRANLLSATLLVTAPVAIRTQLFKHKCGFVENEVSRRYVSDPPRFFLPEVWRQRGEAIKQGSLDAQVKHPLAARAVAKVAYTVSGACYRTLLALGVCPEQARFALAQGMETQWYWTAGLLDFHRVVALRLSPHAQRETWQIAKKLDEIMRSRYPSSWKALSKLR